MSRAVPGLLLIAGLGLAACEENKGSGGAAPTTSASTSPAATSAAPSASAATGTPAASASAAVAEGADDPKAAESLREFHRHHHHGGLTMFIAMSIDTLGLDAAKKAQVDKIQSDLHTKMQPARDAEHDLLSTIADGVAAGKIDTAKVDAAVAKVTTASAGIHNATTDALTQLHDTLSPAERLALVDKVKGHWEIWHKANIDEKSSAKDKGTRLAKLTERLALTPDQVDKITTALGTDPAVTPQTDPKPVDTYVNSFATAFVADKFDPKALAPQATAAAGHIAKHGAARTAKFYEAVTPVLTADQRTKLAAELKEHVLKEVKAEKSAAAGEAK
jgi:Spy/CpxP family protein refolding chaperone